MPIDTFNGVRLFWEQRGDSGPALVLVHGSWGDRHNWDAVVPGLAASCRVFTYDRRGHSQSERLAGQGRIDEDVADLAAVIRHHNLAPAHVVGNSYGAAIAVRLAASQPDLVASLVVHEPPLVDLIKDEPAMEPVLRRVGAVLETLRSGDVQAGARQFVDTVAFGPGMWDRLPRELQETFVFNAPTFVDEMNEPGGAMTVDLERLAAFTRPVLLSRGDESPPFFGIIVSKLAMALPNVRQHTFRGAGHVPQLTHPEAYVAAVTEFVTMVKEL